MITTLVVALDLASDGHRALPVVRALAELGVVDVELLTVSTPNLADDVDRVRAQPASHRQRLASPFLRSSAWL